MRLEELAIAPDEGGEALERVLAGLDEVQVVVSTANLSARIERWISRPVAAQGVAEFTTQPAAFHARPTLLTPYVAPHNEIEEKLVGIWQELLGVEPVGIHDNFFELGSHSLLAVQIISRARQVFEMELALNNLFEQPTIAFLAEYIATLCWALQDQAGAQPEEVRQEIAL